MKAMKKSSANHTPLQSSFPKEYLNRSFKKAKKMFRDTDVKFFLNFARAIRHSNDPEITVLDLGCGSGTTIEDFWQKMSNPNWRYKRRLHGKKLNTIGIDLNLLPEIIPKWIFKTTPKPQTKFLKADAENIPLHDNSVDFAYSVGLLRYLKDPLRAIEEGYRVLKPGGIFLWLLSGYTDISTKPTLEKILADTPSASESFQLCFGWSRMRGTLICKKKSTSKFSKFPFILSNSFPKTIKTQATDDFLEHRVYKRLP
jgi:ubiquinone/menaquinone biosynthesis C-methylase UbiE